MMEDEGLGVLYLTFADQCSPRHAPRQPLVNIHRLLLDMMV